MIGSRPRTSSTWTSRSCRLSWTPPRSSSKTVGSVRTVISRSRQAATTLPRSSPGAEGIAIVTSSGRSRRGSGRSRRSCRAPGRRAGASPACAGRRRGSRSRWSPRFGFSWSSRTTIWPPGAGADDERPALLARGAPAGGALHRHPRQQPDPADQREGQQEVRDDHRARDRVVEGPDQQEGDGEDRGRGGDRAQDAEQVGQAEVAPPLLVEAEARRRRPACRSRRRRSTPRASPGSGRARRPRSRGSAAGRPCRRRTPREPRRPRSAARDACRRGVSGGSRDPSILDLRNLPGSNDGLHS